MKVNLLALDGVFDTGLATVQDVFSTANELAGMLGVDIPPFELRVTGMRKRVHTSQAPARAGGLGARRRPRPTGSSCRPSARRCPRDCRSRCSGATCAEAAAALRAQAGRGVRIAAACVGTFVLAESGLLDQRQATTTWWLASLFRQRYPAVKLDESRMLVSSGPFVTAGAALSHIDMALLLVRQASPELAATVAKYLIVDSRPSQSAYVITDHLTHSDPTVQRFERWARGRLADGFSLDEAAGGGRHQQAHPRAPHAAGAWQDARCPTFRTCASSAPCTCSRPATRAWSRSPAGRLCRGRDAARPARASGSAAGCASCAWSTEAKKIPADCSRGEQTQ